MPNITLKTTDFSYNGTQYSGEVITLESVNSWDDPVFAHLSPASIKTAMVNSSLVNLSNTSSYYTNIKQAGYYVDSAGVLHGYTVAGSAYVYMDCVGVTAGDTVIINGATFTAVSGSPSDLQFQVSTNAQTALNLITAVNSTNNASIKGIVQADFDVLSPNNRVFFEAVTVGTGGNSLTITANNGSRTPINGTVTSSAISFSGGAASVTPSAPVFYISHTITFSTPLPANIPAAIQFTLSGVNTTPLSGANAFVSFQLSNPGTSFSGTLHQDTFTPSNNQFTMPSHSEAQICTELTVGITISNYNGQFDLSQINILTYPPQTYQTAGEFIGVVNLSQAAPSPPGDPTTGLGGAVKQLLLLLGSANIASELVKGGTGTYVITDIGDPVNGISTNAQAIVSQAIAKGMLVFGYIPIGKDANPSGLLPYNDAQIQTMVLRAASLKCTGVYFDICSLGPPYPLGYGVTRHRQEVCNNYAHTSGLKVIWNDITTIFDTTINTTLGDLEKTSSTDAGTYYEINDGTSLTFNSGDGCLVESWGWSGTGSAQPWSNFQTTGAQILLAEKNGMLVHPLLYKPTGSTVLNQSYLRDFAFIASAMYGATSYSLYDQSGATGYNDNVRDPIYIGSLWVDAQPNISTSGNAITRASDMGYAEIYQDPTKASTDPTARNGLVFQTYHQVTVNNFTDVESYSPPGTTVNWYASWSSDGVTYTSEIGLTDTGSGTVTGFPTTSINNILKLRGVLQTTSTSNSPTVTLPMVLSVSYTGGAYATLQGTVLPTVLGDTVAPVNVQIQRLSTDPIHIGPIEYNASVESHSVVVNPTTGIWSLSVACASSGTTYKVTVSAGVDSYSVTLTLLPGTTVNADTVYTS